VLRSSSIQNKYIVLHIVFVVKLVNDNKLLKSDSNHKMPIEKCVLALIQNKMCIGGPFLLRYGRI